MIADGDTVEDRRIQGATLVLAALATTTAESAVGGPERPLGLSLAWAAVWVGITVAAHRGTRGFHSARGEAGRILPCKNTALRPLLVIALLAILALVAVEPTPGYAFMAPAWSWTHFCRSLMATALRWTRSHVLLLVLTAAGLAALVRLHRDIADALATLAWKATTSADPRRHVIKALHLVERRSNWAGRPRPSGQTPRRWYESIANSSPNDADTLQRLIQLADWGLHAPLGAISPHPRNDDLRETCRRAVAAWTLRRFRAVARTTPYKEIAK